MDTLILSAADIRTIVRSVGLDAFMDEVIERLESVCLSYSADEFDVPPRGGLTTDSESLIEWMPIRHNGYQATIKIVGYHPRNPRQRALPTVLSVALEFDADSGHLNVLADATFATALRTGAASAIASRILANPDSSCLGLVGAGAQALSQLHALSRIFKLREVLVFDVDNDVSRTFPERARRIGLENLNVVPAELNVVTSRADILCTATSVGVDKGPVIPAEALHAHLHINAVGSDFPGKTELPRE